MGSRRLVYRCVLLSRSPIGEDVPDDAVVSLADEEVEGALPSRVAATRAPASRARGKLDATSRDEGAEPQDLFVSQSAMRLPAAGRTHARDECSDRTDVSGIFAIGIDAVKSFDSVKVSFFSGLSNLLWKFLPIHFLWEGDYVRLPAPTSGYWAP